MNFGSHDIFTDKDTPKLRAQKLESTFDRVWRIFGELDKRILTSQPAAAGVYGHTSAMPDVGGTNPDHDKRYYTKGQTQRLITAAQHAPVTVQDTETVNLTLTGQQISADVIQSGLDHGSIGGLSDDDHTQYHNDARGDARYSLLAHKHYQLYGSDLATVALVSDASNNVSFTESAVIATDKSLVLGGDLTTSYGKLWFDSSAGTLMLTMDGHWGAEGGVTPGDLKIRTAISGDIILEAGYHPEGNYGGSIYLQPAPGAALNAVIGAYGYMSIQGLGDFGDSTYAQILVQGDVDGVPHVGYRSKAQLLSDIGAVGGSGTAGYMPKLTDVRTIADGPLYVDGSGNVMLGGTTPGSLFDVRGMISLSNASCHHGMTAIAADTTGGYLQTGATGALTFGGLSDSDTNGIWFFSVIGSETASDATPCMKFTGGKKSSTAWQALQDAGTLMQVFNYTTPKFTILGDGTTKTVKSFYAGSLTQTAPATYYSGEAITAHAHYGFLDDSTLDNSGAIATLGHASFNCNVKLQGTNNFDHHGSYQSVPHMDGSGTIAVMRSFHSIPFQTAGTITEMAHVQVDDIQQSGGTCGTQYALLVGNLDAATANWCIHSSGASVRSYHNGNFGIKNSDPQHPLHVRGAARFGRTGDDIRNLYWDATGSLRLYYNSVVESNISYTGGDHWFGANSGTAGAGAQMLLQGSTGNLGVGRTPTAGYRLDIAAALALVKIESTTGTNSAWHEIANTGGSLILGKVRSTGNQILTSALAYAAAIRDTGGYGIQFGVGTAIGMTLTASNTLGVGTATAAAKFAVNGGCHIGGDSDPGDNNLLVDGTIVGSGDTYWTGAGSGLPYGSCYGNEIAWSQAGAVQNTWYNISDADMADGELNAVTHDGSGKLTATIAGRYLITYSMTIECSITNQHVKTGIEINGSGAAINPGQQHAHFAAANTEHQVSGTAIVSLSANQTIEAAVMAADAGTPTILVDHLTITAVHIGG